MAHIHELIDFTVTGFVVFNQKVLLILHKKLGLWLPPGGHIELDEDPEEALLREIREECGMEVSIWGEKPRVLSERTKPLHVPAFMDIHKISDSHRHVGLQYFCTTSSDAFTLNQDELNDIRWFSEADLDTIELLPEIKQYAQAALRTVV